MAIGNRQWQSAIANGNRQSPMAIGSRPMAIGNRQWQSAIANGNPQSTIRNPQSGGFC
jgi:hypothetical protein